MSAPDPAGHDRRNLLADERTEDHGAQPSDPGSEAAVAQAPAVDLEHLLGFTDGDLQLEGELSALFLSSAGVYLERMAEALRNGEPWRQAAHALKGASANLGARQMAAVALQAEHSDPSPGRLRELRRALDEVRQFFEQRQAS